MAVKSYQDLLVWQKAMEYVVLCYELTKYFPKEELFGLTFQLKKSSVSIPSNIAEGFGRLKLGEYLYFLGVAQGSLKESETQVIVAFRLKYISVEQQAEALAKAREVGILLGRLIDSLQRKQKD